MIVVVGCAMACNEKPSQTAEEHCSGLVAEALEQVAAPHVVDGGDTDSLRRGAMELLARRDTLAKGLVACGRSGAIALLSAIRRLPVGNAREYLIGMLSEFDPKDIEHEVQAIAQLDLSKGEVIVISSMMGRYRGVWAKQLALAWSYSDDGTLRMNAVACLAGCRDEVCVSRLREILRGDPNPRVRRNAAAMGSRGTVMGESAELEVLCEAAGDADADVRKAAMQSLRRVVDPAVLRVRPLPRIGKADSLVRWYEQVGRRLVWDENDRRFKLRR